GTARCSRRGSRVPASRSQMLHAISRGDPAGCPESAAAAAGARRVPSRVSRHRAAISSVLARHEAASARGRAHRCPHSRRSSVRPNTRGGLDRGSSRTSGFQIREKGRARPFNARSTTACYRTVMAARKDQLATYRRKRDFRHTPEPARTPRRRRTADTGERRFVIHLHHARRRHFDLRLQVGGVLRSWAVPKGPSRDPSIKHLAVQVEDHPLSYGSFEGVIPKGNYGAGTVAIWDEGTWSTDESATQQLEDGHLRFELHGSRLHGSWSLIRTSMKADKPQWLLIKSDDAFVVPDDVADDTPLSQWKAEHGGETTRAPRAKRAARSSKAIALPDASRFEFQLARLHHSAPAGDDWLHEVKYDGYRMLAWRNGSELQLLSRNRLDWTEKLPAIARAIRSLKCRACVLDGELVVFDGQGRSRFHLLQQEFNRAQSQAVHYAVFDLLWLDGDDLRDLPLYERKAALSKLLEHADDALVISGFIRGEGALAYKRACEAGLEGVIAKSVDSPYRGGRSDAWQKLKCIDSDEFVIVGYTPGKGSRGDLGALLLAEPKGKEWRYVGRVGTGFDEAMLKQVFSILKPAREKPE